jgi:hypothetical protein
MNIQKKIIRLISFKSYLEHTEPLFQNLKILNINDYLSCLFMYRFKRLQNLPEFFNGYFAQNNEVHHYNTRNANKFLVNFSRTNYAKRSIVNKGAKIWNSLDKEISSIIFYCTFKKKSKIFFL